jgi:hypothetical protein
MKVTGYAYPWDVLEPVSSTGRPNWGWTRSRSPWPTGAATPWSRRQTAVLARHAALYRPLRGSAWSRLRPGVPDWEDSPDAAGAIERLNAAGIPAAAWLVLTHDSRLGAKFPQLAVRNCFGERYPGALCPAQEEVRTLRGELGRGIPGGAGRFLGRP